MVQQHVLSLRGIAGLCR